MLNKKLIVKRNETAHVLSERSVLIKMLNHPYLVQLHFAFTTAHKIFFVLDYVNGGEVSEWVGTHASKQVGTHARQGASA